MDKKKVSQHDSETVAENNFHFDFEEKQDRSKNKGLAKTNEQAVDTWIEGSIEGEIDDINGKDEELRGK